MDELDNHDLNQVIKVTVNRVSCSQYVTLIKYDENGTLSIVFFIYLDIQSKPNHEKNIRQIPT